MGFLPSRPSKTGQFVIEYRRHGAQLFEMVLPAAVFHRNPDHQRNHFKQQAYPDLGHDRGGVVVDNFVLYLLSASAFADNLENENISVFMERIISNWSGCIVVCNKLDII